MEDNMTDEELQAIKARYIMPNNYEDHGAEEANLRAEVERLRTELANGGEIWLSSENAKLRAEVERLNAKIKKDEGTMLAYYRLVGEKHALQVEVERLRAENDRLRGEDVQREIDAWIESLPLDER
jgi:uncharacterized small protein (DUF1192 family)